MVICLPCDEISWLPLANLRRFGAAGKTAGQGFSRAKPAPARALSKKDVAVRRSCVFAHNHA